MTFDGEQTVWSPLGDFFGTALYVRNPVKAWWGEGDEKIFVDGALSLIEASDGRLWLTLFNDSSHL